MLLNKLNRLSNVDPYAGIPIDDYNPTILFLLQLTPELSELIAQYRRVCFIDAHTGNISEEILFRRIKPEFQTNPFTHHLSPDSCMSLVYYLYQKQPEAVLLSIRGYEFGFSQKLSKATSKLLDKSLNTLLNWITEVD